MSATLVENGTAQVRWSTPPADVYSGTVPTMPTVRWSAPPPNVAGGARPAAGATSLGAELRLSAPPADVVAGAAPVVAVGLEWEDLLGSDPSPERPAARPAARVLDNREIYRIIREVAVPLSGEELYRAVAADEQLGLLYGFVLFPQASVHLGSVLRLMRARAEAAFRDVFGASVDELLAVTNAPLPSDRLAPVEGRMLWQEPWVSRFRRAGEVAEFQAAQNEEAIEHQFRPLLRPMIALGLSTSRSLACAYDIAATHGVGGGIRWIVDAAGPIKTDAQRTHALSTLGFADVAAFQATVPELPQNGAFGPATHAALVGALRAQDLLPMPTADDLVGRLVRASESAAGGRLERLVNSDALDDEPVTG